MELQELPKHGGDADNRERERERERAREGGREGGRVYIYYTAGQ